MEPTKRNTCFADIVICVGAIRYVNTSQTELRKKNLQSLPPFYAYTKHDAQRPFLYLPYRP